MKIKSKIGLFEGKSVDEISLVSDKGVELSFLNWGATLRDWRVPVGNKLRSVVLGFDDFKFYPDHSPNFGCIVGRVANRISNSQFSINNQSYSLTPNVGAHHLHGGPEGLGRRVWDYDIDSSEQRIKFYFKSLSGEMGYPGNLNVEAVYTLKDYTLSLEISAQVDQETPINLVPHHYFNLGESPIILDHHCQIDGISYVELNDDLLPTGEIIPVESTRYDFRKMRTLEAKDPRDEDFDITIVLDPKRNQSNPAAQVLSPNKDLQLKLWTNQPSLQLYNSMWTDVSVPGLSGATYKKHAGLCLEDQMFPDAVNHNNFPSILHGPDKAYYHSNSIEISPL